LGSTSILEVLLFEKDRCIGKGLQKRKGKRHNYWMTSPRKFGYDKMKIL
jgi:hypothetical protein